jgi:hypothetical protein
VTKKGYRDTCNFICNCHKIRIKESGPTKYSEPTTTKLQIPRTSPTCEQPRIVRSPPQYHRKEGMPLLNPTKHTHNWPIQKHTHTQRNTHTKTHSQNHTHRNQHTQRKLIQARSLPLQSSLASFFCIKGLHNPS